MSEILFNTTLGSNFELISVTGP